MPSLMELVAASVSLKRRGRDFWSVCPFHSPDKTGSFKVGRWKGKERFYCLAPETLVRTTRGLVAVADLAGTTASVLSRNSTYISAQFSAYGHQRLWQLDLCRNQQRKRLFVTAEHRWFTRYKEKTTQTLMPGDTLDTTIPPQHTINQLDASGVRHGIVYGDGSCQPHHRAYVELHGAKNIALLTWFPGFKTKSYNNRCALKTIRVNSLPPLYKSLPISSASDPYIAGFLAGLIAADGHVDASGSIMLHARERAVLEWVRESAYRLGIITYGVTLQMRKGYCETEQPIHRVMFDKKTFPVSLLLMTEARDRFARNPPHHSRLRWTVASSSPTARHEEVFCGEVPGEHSFALADDILTGNCFGCGARGDAADWLMLTRNVGFKEAKRILGEETARPDPAIAAARQAAQRRDRTIAAYRDRRPDCLCPDWLLTT